MAPRYSVDQCSENEAEEPLLPETTNLIIQGDQTSRRYLLIVFGVGVLVLANLTQALIILRIVNKTSAKPSAKYHPDFPMQALTIERNMTWEELSNPSSDSLWNTALPGITGWVQIEHARDYKLPPGIPSLGKFEVYITTWGHQHHCLKILRREFSSLVRGESLLINSMTNGTKTPNNETSGKLHHLMHCFDYLRQTVACTSDLTLEGISKESNDTFFDIDGYGVEHMCKSQNAIGEWLISHAPEEDGFRQNIEL
ncbi:hypothetical protein THAR02_07467 [Trichoderma harzianum]|uniref:Tat pathway signal sequence n=1 Tax=Trichoderma harzianum TaxID=5544 RepID=A0A0F9ZJF5_TRIHA|nr:hypothetical protein THAR02_07467 [Trichoderma harzianum]